MMLSRRSFSSGIIAAALEPEEVRSGQRKTPRRASRAPPASEPFLMALAITSSLSWYYSSCNRGASAYAQSASSPYVILENQGRFERLSEQVKDLVKTSNGKLVLCIDLASRLDIQPLVTTLVSDQVYFTTHSSRKLSVHPWAFNPYYVANTASDHSAAGAATAATLIEAMGGRGRIVALGGLELEYAAQKRRTGLNLALAQCAHCTLLDFRAADWQASLAFDITKYWTSKYRGQIDGIWAANDEMAIGAIEALRVYGAAGKVPVVGMDGHPAAIDAVKAGELLATVPWDGYYMAGLGLALADGARLGLLNPSKEPDDHREFYLTFDLITRRNVAHFQEQQGAARSNLDWRAYWSRADGQILD